MHRRRAGRRSRAGIATIAAAALGLLGACDTGPGGTPDPDVVNDAPAGEDPDGGIDD